MNELEFEEMIKANITDINSAKVFISDGGKSLIQSNDEAIFVNDNLEETYDRRTSIKLRLLNFKRYKSWLNDIKSEVKNDQ